MFASLPRDLARLRLRALRMDDLDAFHACRSDPRVARYQGWSPLTRLGAEAFLRMQSGGGEPVRGTWRQLAIAERATDRLVGDMGVRLAPDAERAEFGLSIAHGAQERGYGTECVRGLIALLFEATSISEIVAATDTRNVACVALLVRVGMREIARRQATYKGELCMEQVFALRRGGIPARNDVAGGQGEAGTIGG